MMLLLQAIGSKYYSVPASQVWNSFTRPTLNYNGTFYITSNAPLFIHQYSHAWFDFRNRRDAYTNYFENSINATKAFMQWTQIYLAPKFSDYSPTLWGVSASDAANGYFAWGGPSLTGSELNNPPIIDGTIVPYASAGSLPFMPAEALAVLKNINATYPQVWGRYVEKKALC